MAFPEGVGMDITTTALIHSTVSSINELAADLQKAIDEGAETFVISKENIQGMVSLLKTSAMITSNLFEGHQKFADVLEEVKKKHNL
jgi:hypothetical protein